MSEGYETLPQDSSWEIATHLLIPLPIDQRYGDAEMEYIISRIEPIISDS